MKHLLHYRKLKNSTKKKTITCCRYLLRLHGVEPPPSGQLFSQIIFNFVVFVALASKLLKFACQPGIKTLNGTGRKSVRIFVLSASVRCYNRWARIWIPPENCKNVKFVGFTA